MELARYQLESLKMKFWSLLIEQKEPTDARVSTTTWVHISSSLRGGEKNPILAVCARFPGVFNAVTLAAYKKPSQKETPATRLIDYRHLIDGGPADNLGVDSLISAVDSFVSSQSPHAPPLRGCLMIIGDASQGQPRHRAAHRRDPRSGTDFIIDRTVIDATDTMLWLQRRRLLQELAPPYAVQTFEPVWNYNQRVILGNGQQITVPCMIWHLRIDRLNELRVGPTVHQDVHEFRRKTQLVAQGAETHYKLTGLGCSSETIQTALYDVAEIVVREDREALAKVCSWLSDKGVGSDACHP